MGVHQNPQSTPYELIDSDPHFNRVVRFFRSSDYAVWAAGTVGFPALLLLMEGVSPVGSKRFKVPAGIHMRTSTLLGFFGGFQLAYCRSTLRFWGWQENSREIEKDRYETKASLAQNINPYNQRSSLPAWLQGISTETTTNSQLNMAMIPLVNVTHHPFHGIDIRKYYEVRPGEEKWGFNLTLPKELEGEFKEPVKERRIGLS